jgi:hypothetical protein
VFPCGEMITAYLSGIEVKENDIFYDIVMPFLPTDAVKEFETYLNEIN